MSIFTGAGVALVTPMNADGSVNFEKMKELIEFQIANGTDALIICGTTGEATTISDEDQIECVRFAKEVAAGRVPVIAGAGSNDTAHCIELAQACEKVGADGVLLVTPYYNKATQKGLILHYTAIANSIHIPIILYNVPGRTGCNLTPKTVAELAKVENIVAVKEASGNLSQVAEIAALVGSDFDIYSGNDDQILPVLSLGGKGVISVLSNVAPKETHDMVVKFLNGDVQGAIKLQLDAIELISALFCEVNPIPVKTALNLMGYEVGACKLPLCDMEPKNLETLKTAIKNSLEICLSGKAGDVSSIMDKFLNMAKRNVTRLSGIINDLLDLSKVEAGKMDFKFEKLNINTPVEFMKNTFENVAKEKNIDLVFEKEENIDETYIDTQRIEQVMSNLISNAIKFTNEGGKIIVKTENIKESEIDKTILIGEEKPVFYDNYIKVSVKDSGIGIAQEDLKKVFDQFQQIENSLNRKNGGTGLGLPIAKQLIEAHRGFIWVESELNIGTTFSFVIPVLSEKEKFIIDLDKDIQKAKTCNHSLLLLMIKENQEVENSFIEDVKSEKISLIRKTANTKEVYFNEENTRNYAILLPEADKFAQSFIEKKIESTLEQNKTSEKKYDILYSTVLYPDNATDATEMISEAEELIKNNKVEAKI